jgi:RHS repeat-associated protein
MKMYKSNIIIGLLVVLTGSAMAVMPKDLPKLKNAQELEQWRTDVTAKAGNSAREEQQAFYTGEPYIVSTGGYAFKCRNYNPAMARWTTEDPSGFPDGANQNVYAPTPTSAIDAEGLFSVPVTITLPWTSVLGYKNNAQWDGLYKWTLIQRAETSDIDQTPGLTGQLPVNNVAVGGLGLGSYFDPVKLRRSNYEYRTSSGVREQRYKVDLQEDIYLVTSTTRSLFKSGPRFLIYGNWYE